MQVLDGDALGRGGGAARRRPRRVLAALGMRKTSSSDAQVDDQVVDDAAGRRRSTSCTAPGPGRSARRSLVRQAFDEGGRAGPGDRAPCPGGRRRRARPARAPRCARRRRRRRGTRSASPSRRSRPSWRPAPRAGRGAVSAGSVGHGRHVTACGRVLRRSRESARMTTVALATTRPPAKLAVDTLVVGSVRDPRRRRPRDRGTTCRARPWCTCRRVLSDVEATGKADEVVRVVAVPGVKATSVVRHRPGRGHLAPLLLPARGAALGRRRRPAHRARQARPSRVALPTPDLREPRRPWPTAPTPAATPSTSPPRCGARRGTGLRPASSASRRRRTAPDRASWSSRARGRARPPRMPSRAPRCSARPATGPATW